MVKGGDDRIKVGISSCLLGQPVRYDGQHKYNRDIVELLGQYFDFVPFCPEVAIGMGVPRPPIRLVKYRQRIRAQGVDNAEIDVTDQLAAYGASVASTLKNISGYIFKQGSPSCGTAGVKVYSAKGRPRNNGTGIYAKQLMTLLPDLPIEEEARLIDPVQRENFMARVIDYHLKHQSGILKCVPHI